MTFTFNSGGELQEAQTSGSATGQPNVALSYTYDQNRNETSVTDNLSSAGITTISYDLDERVGTVAFSYGGTAGPQVTYSYDPASRVTLVSRAISPAGRPMLR